MWQQFSFTIYSLLSNNVGALIVEPKLRFRKLSKRFVKFVDANGELKSSLSCSPFVLDSLDADTDAFRTLALCVLLSAASFESWPLYTVELVLRFVNFRRENTRRHKFMANVRIHVKNNLPNARGIVFETI